MKTHVATVVLLALLGCATGSPANSSQQSGADGGSTVDAGGPSTHSTLDAATDVAASHDGGTGPDAHAGVDAGPTMCGTIDMKAVQQDQGNSYVLTKNFGFLGDSTAAPQHSPMKLYENGHELGAAHSALATIRASGGGAFSHRGNTLYFSSSDNTDPRTNGRTYSFGGPCWQPIAIDLVTVSPASTDYATFQTHNQRIVESGGSIFLSYLPAIPSGDLATWRVARSTDQGHSFSTILEGSNITKAPSLERDDQGNVYAFLSQNHDQQGAPGLFYRFDAANNFASPSTNSIANGSAGKFTTYFDSFRQQIYLFTFKPAPTPSFFAVNLDGTVAYSLALTQPGSHAGVEYPFLGMEGANLFAAWTTAPNGTSATNYWDIHWMVSGDGGHNWTPSVNASYLTLPVVADDTGPTYRITLNDEFGPDTFLAAMFPRNGKVHFMYDVYQMQRQHYLRVDAVSGNVEENIWPTWQGGNGQMHAFDGFFVTAQNGWLFAVGGGDDQRLVILASNDDGETWLDYARSDPMPKGYVTYSVTGSRQMSADGHILGAFTQQQYPNVNDAHFVKFFRVDSSRVPQ